MITKIGSGQYGTATYLVDTPSEVANLPTKDGVGSAAISVQDGKIYMLNGEKVWVEYGEGGDSNA